MTEVATEERPKTESAGPSGLSEELVRTVEDALEEGDIERAGEVAASLHAADQADLLEQLRHEERLKLVAELKPTLDPELLTYLDETVREEVLEQLTPEETGAAIAQLDTDDAIEVLGDLDETEQIAILETLPMPERAAVEQGLTYPEDSAGRLMQRELVAAPEFWTVGQTIDYLRAKPDLPDDFYDIYIVNPRFEPVGSIPLSKILRSRRGVLLTELKLKERHLIPFDMDQEEVGFVFRQYGLVSAPVVDANRRLLGVITVDDVVHVIEEEAEEDILKLGGVPEADIFAPPLRTSMHRVPWLLLNLCTASLAALVVAQFEATIREIVILAALMPVVVSLGGNAGIQALTVTVRALALKQITKANALRILGKELLAAGLNGLVLLIAGILLVLGWIGEVDLGVVFGAGIILTIIVASLVGVTVPIVLDRIGLDPAVSSSVFVTTIADVFGFFAFLGLAALYLL
ncbi:MAG TPA: magnesium transporter [Geminicoccaceae bacterium]|nr:magnesium transporter [Geminicoccaceae bacterium]